MDQQSGIIFDIQRSSMHDGPGIRTAVFFKGCPLSCKWCHNPESQQLQPQLAFFAEKCIRCKRCEIECKKQVHTFTADTHVVSSELCGNCRRCVDSCLMGP